MMCPEVVAYYPVSAFIPHLALTAITCRTPQCQQHGFSIQHQCLPLEPLAQMSSDWPSLSVFKSPTTDGWQEMAVSARLPEAKGPRRPGAGTVLYCVSSTSFQVIHIYPSTCSLPASRPKQVQSCFHYNSQSRCHRGTLAAASYRKLSRSQRFVSNVDMCFLFTCVLICCNVELLM